MRPRALPIRRARELRREATPAERLLWGHIRDRQLGGLKFRRQCPIDGFIMDFFCFSHRLAIELDGETHQGLEAASYDVSRDEILRMAGIHVLRFSNDEVYTALEGVLAAIYLTATGDVWDGRLRR